jgi:hypothetical protein
VSGYEHLSALSTSFSASLGSPVLPIQIACPAGKSPMGGGHELANVNAAGLTVMFSAPVRDTTFVGWRVMVRNVHVSGGISGAQVRVHVVCANVS